MKTYRRWVRIVSAALGLVVLIVAWIAFAPTQFGGQTSYAIVNGNSMEPVFQRDDLVIVRQATDYQIGDIVTYYHPQIGPIIHRMVGREDERFVFKGDNNSWTDSYQPSLSELAGKAWIRLPSVGRVVKELRTPLNLAILTGVLGVIMMSVLITNQEQRQWHQRGYRRTNGQNNQPNSLSEVKEGLLFASVTLALVSLLLAFFAFTRPLSRTVTDDIPYKHTGLFNYFAAAPPGVYDSKVASAGEPVFRRLTNTFKVEFTYEIANDQLSDPSGTYRLIAEVSDVNGWKRTIELKPETSFSGNAFTVSSVVELNQVQALIDNLEKQTGIHQTQYTLAIVPQVMVQGTLAGEDLQDQFAPRLAFRLDSLQLQLAKEDPRAEPLKPSQKGVLKHSHTEPNTLSLFGFSLSIFAARTLALIGLAISLIGIVVLGVVMVWVGRDEAAQVRLKYGPMLVTIKDNNLRVTDRVVKVASIDELARLAEKDGRMILHQDYGKAHNYFVQDTAVTYAYQISPNGLQSPDVEIIPALDPVIVGWSRFLALRDGETNGHSQRVTELTLRLADRLGMREADLTHLRRGVMLHDIGKVGIPDSILLKPGPLTSDEWEIMQKHPEYAYEVLAPIPELNPALVIPYCHHERWDGTGYPRRLRGEQIPLEARIFAVVDVWDSLCSDRPYRKAWSEDQAMEYIRQEAGAHFDPQVVDVFIETLAEPSPQVMAPQWGGLPLVYS